MSTFLYQFLFRLDRLIPSIAAIFSFVFAGLGFFNKIQSSVTLEIILFVLGFILAANVIDNFISISRIHNNLEIIKKSFSTADKYLTTKINLPKLEPRLQNANEIWACSATLLGLISPPSHFNLFKELLYQGTNIKFMTYKENLIFEKQVINLWPYDDRDTEKKELFENTLKSSYIYLNRFLREKTENPRKMKGKIEIRFLTEFLPHSLLIINPKLMNSVIQLQMDVYGCNSSYDLPIIQFSNNEDSRFYNLFLQEYEFLWNTGEVFNLENR